MPQYKCNHCKEPVNFLFLNREVSQEGIFRLDSGYYEKETTDQDNVLKEQFFCPSCETETTEELLIKINS